MSDGDAPQTTTTRASIDVLDRQQDRLLYGDRFDGAGVRGGDVPPLTEGFDSLWQAVLWYQAAGVRTLGHIADVFAPYRLLSDRRTQQALVWDTKADRYLRLRLAERVDEACNPAYRTFYRRAEERVTKGDDTSEISYEQVDPDKQKYIGMRPSFSKLDQVQATKLRSLRAGFDSRPKLSRWVRELRPATVGTLSDDLMDDLLSSRSMTAALLCKETAQADRETREFQRLQFAINELLPGYVAAARQLNGSERHRTKSNPNAFNDPSKS